MNTPPPLPARPSPRFFKAIGWLLTVVGLLLAVAMVVITRYMVGVVNAPVLPGRLPSWTGSHALTVHMFWLFGGVFLFGLLSLANGLWTVRHGVLQPVLRALLLLLAAVLVIATAIMGNSPP